MKRYHMHKDGWMMESLNRCNLEWMRRANKSYFRCARITQVLQLQPSRVPLDTIVRMENHYPKRFDPALLLQWNELAGKLVNR